MSRLEEINTLIGETLQIEDEVAEFTLETPLLGHIPELDSMAVVTLITALEEQYDIIVEDDEISADTFTSVGTLVQFVEDKLES